MVVDWTGFEMVTQWQFTSTLQCDVDQYLKIAMLLLILDKKSVLFMQWLLFQLSYDDRVAVVQASFELFKRVELSETVSKFSIESILLDRYLVASIAFTVVFVFIFSLQIFLFIREYFELFWASSQLFAVSSYPWY